MRTFRERAALLEAEVRALYGFNDRTKDKFRKYNTHRHYHKAGRLDSHINGYLSIETHILGLEALCRACLSTIKHNKGIILDKEAELSMLSNYMDTDDDLAADAEQSYRETMAELGIPLPTVLDEDSRELDLEEEESQFPSPDPYIEDGWPYIKGHNEDGEEIIGYRPRTACDTCLCGMCQGGGCTVVCDKCDQKESLKQCRMFREKQD